MAGTDLVPVDEYAVMQLDTRDPLLALRENIGKAQLTEFDLDRVKMPAGGGRAWEVPTLDGVVPQPAIEGVIVHWKDTRAYWQEQFTGGNAPPDCSSRDAEHAQGDPGVPVAKDDAGFWLCETCPNAQFGSAPGDSNAQACKLVRQLFVLTPEDLLPVVVSLPPTSVGTCRQFFLRLARSGTPFHGIITRIGLEQEKSGGGITYSRATFQRAGVLDGEAGAKLRAYADALRPTLEQAAANVAEAARDATGVAA